MRRLRASAAASTRPRIPVAQARNNIRAAASLLAWLRARGISLAGCTQAGIDRVNTRWRLGRSCGWGQRAGSAQADWDLPARGEAR
jgi:hypothetical protein